MANVIASWIATIGGLIAAFLAVSTFRQNVKLSRAKWMKELYEKFYEREDLKSVRDQLDSGDEQGIAKRVIQETSSFTDYLNFFMIIYLTKVREGMCSGFKQLASQRAEPGR